MPKTTQTLITLILGLFSILVYGQSKVQLPNFSLDGINSGTISVADLVTHLTIVTKNPSLKVVSYELTVNAPDQRTSIFLVKGSTIPSHKLWIFSKMKDNQLGKLWIDNLKALKTNGDTAYLRTPLILTVKK